MRIITNNHPRDLVLYCQLEPKEQKELDWVEDQFENCFRYKGRVYALSEFLAPQPGTSLPGEWHGIAADSFFSGTLVQIVDDCTVKVATYFN